jgi:hypothetical protein
MNQTTTNATVALTTETVAVNQTATGTTAVPSLQTTP